MFTKRLTDQDIKDIILPSSLFKNELYKKTPGYRIRHDGYLLFDIVNRILDISGITGGGSLVDNNDGTYTFTAADGVVTDIDTNADSNPVDTTSPNINNSYVNVQLALEGIFDWIAANSDPDPKYVTLQEFLSNELIVNRTGETFWVVPPDLDGHTITAFYWSVFTPDTGTFSIELFANNIAIPGTGIGVLSNAQGANESLGTGFTLSTGDRIHINTSSISGVPPTGLSITLTITP